MSRAIRLLESWYLRYLAMERISTTHSYSVGPKLGLQMDDLLAPT